MPAPIIVLKLISFAVIGTSGLLAPMLAPPAVLAGRQFGPAAGDLVAPTLVPDVTDAAAAAVDPPDGPAPATVPATPPASQPDIAPAHAPAPPPDAAPPPGTSADVWNLLGALERGGDDLRAFSADVHYISEDELLGEKVIRQGTLIYQVTPETGKRFAIRFDTEVADRRKRTRLQHYIFAGRWLVEIDHEDKLFIKREVVAPGQQFDPFRLGEGPIPLPIGQRRDEVLSRFAVTLQPLPADGPLARLAEAARVDGVRLVPRPGSELAREYDRIDLFYDRATRLPVGVDVLEPNGDRKTVRLDALKRNPELSAEQIGFLRIEDPDPRQWHIDVRPLGK